MCLFPVVPVFVCKRDRERESKTRDSYMSLSSLTRLAVSWKESSVGEYMLDFSRFTGFSGGISGCGWLVEMSSVLKADCLSRI